MGGTISFANALSNLLKNIMNFSKFAASLLLVQGNSPCEFSSGNRSDCILPQGKTCADYSLVTDFTRDQCNDYALAIQKYNENTQNCPKGAVVVGGGLKKTIPHGCAIHQTPENHCYNIYWNGGVEKGEKGTEYRVICKTKTGETNKLLEF